MSEFDWDESSDDDYAETIAQRPRKRRRIHTKEQLNRSFSKECPEPHPASPIESGFFDPLLQTLTLVSEKNGGPDSFERFIESMLPELVEASAFAQVERITSDENGHQIIPMSRLQSRATVDQLSLSGSTQHAVLKRRLILHPCALRTSVLNSHEEPNLTHNSPLTPLRPAFSVPVNPQVLDGLHAIKTTAYESSFLSRLRGFRPSRKNRVLAVDWDNRTSWMDLMRDIRGHFALMHPNREQPTEVEAPIEYSTLQVCHLDQVHNLLGHAFWEGVDVSDALQYSPERCTVIASYKNLVIGAALLSSPQETYITYLAVKPGWDNAQIATAMLYHLITLNPHKDITLHVSINNPAVLLYNRFGFKAEEFIVGFYEDYLDSQSRASKNAFRLRLRQF